MITLTSRKKRHWVYAFWSVAALIGCFGVLLLWRWLDSAQYGKIEIGEAVSTTGNALELGAPITIDVVMQIPWGQNIAALPFKPATGLVMVGDPVGKIILTRIQWGINTYTWQGVFRSFATGKITPGELQLEPEQPYVAPDMRQTALAVKLPELEIAARQVAQDTALPLAGALTAAHSERTWWYASIALLLLLIGAVVLWRLRNKINPPVAPLSAWEIAENELVGLRQIVREGNRPLNWCVARLTDVVREYLSARFNLPVTRQTTAEFLQGLKHDSPLNASQGNRLGEILQTADRIKFAGETPQATALESAITQAETLVAETTPQLEKGEPDHV